MGWELAGTELAEEQQYMVDAEVGVGVDSRVDSTVVLEVGAGTVDSAEVVDMAEVGVVAPAILHTAEVDHTAIEVVEVDKTAAGILAVLECCWPVRVRIRGELEPSCCMAVRSLAVGRAGMGLLRVVEVDVWCVRNVELQHRIRNSRTGLSP